MKEMRRDSYLLLAALLVVGCSANDSIGDTFINDPATKVYKAGFEGIFPEGQETRTYFDDALKLHWNAGDHLSIFKTTLNQEYKFNGSEGATSGEFSLVGSGGSDGASLPADYAVYPYSTGTSISSSGEITLSLPSVQKYVEGSFGPGANTMVAVTKDKEDDFLAFKNVGGYLVLKLYGSGSVKSVTLAGNNGEKIAGKAVVSVSYGSDPVTVMDDSASGTIMVNCGEGVALASTAAQAKSFWFVVPPVTFSGGFTFTITGSNGATIKKSTSKSRTITRNVQNSMSAIEVDLSKEIIEFKDHDLESVLVMAFDTDGDGSLSVQEAESVRSSEDLKSAFGDIKSFTSFDELSFFTGFSGSMSYLCSELFRGWEKLESVTLPDNIKELKYGAFYGCASLKEVRMPDSVTSLGNYLFKGCSGIKSIVIPLGVETIGYGVFEDCSELRDVRLPDSVTEIYSTAFKGCSSLESIDLPANLTSIGEHAFQSCESLLQVTIPKSIEVIPSYCFYNCVSLKAMDIPDSVTSIGEAAFSYCSALLDITIPSGVTSIGKWAFHHCTGLSSIALIPETPPEGGQAMFDDTNNCDIYIPSGTFDLYRLKDAYWSGYDSRLKETK